MFVTLYKICEVNFGVLGTNGCRVKAKNDEFNATSSRWGQNLKYENFMSSFSRPRQKNAPESVLLHVQHDYFPKLNQSNYWFVMLTWPLPSSFIWLPTVLSPKASGWTRRRRDMSTVHFMSPYITHLPRIAGAYLRKWRKIPQILAYAQTPS